MDIRSSMEGLRSLLGVNPAATAAPESKSQVSSGAPGSAFDTDRATLSSAASEVAQAVSGEGARTEKVAAIETALAAGTYNVPASAVAGKVVDAMLGGEQSSGN